jgi:Major tropism determinant N-terminal domain
MAIIKFKRGGGAPGAGAGLTAGEPAFDTTNNALHIHNGTTAIWVGAQIDNDTALAGNSAIRIPTQFAVKSYVDSQVAGGAVSSINGATGAVVLIGGGTYGNTLDINVTSKTIVIRNIGVTAAVAGNGISISGSTGTVTINNTGVTGVTGSANQVAVSANGGYATVSLPTAITTPGSLTTTGNLTVGGNLIVNGTTTTVNSDTVTIQDPVIVLGGTVGINDTKDRGVQFNYGGGNTGFFGYDNSLTRFTMYTSATNTSEVFAGTTGDAGFASLYLGTGANTVRTITSTLTGNRTTILPDWDGTVVAPNGLGSSNNIIRSNGSSQPTWIDPTANGFTAFHATLSTNDVGGAAGSLRYQSAANTSTFLGISGANTILRSTGSVPEWILPSVNGFTAFFATNATNIWGGAAGSLPYQSGANTSTFLGISGANTILRSTGTLPEWISPSVNGFTAFAATNAQTSLIVADTSDTSAPIAFVNNASDSYQALKYNSSLVYNATTNTITASLSGNASSATNATNAGNVFATEQTTGTMYLVGMGAAATTGGLLIDATAQGGATALQYHNGTSTLVVHRIEATIDGGSY